MQDCVSHDEQAGTGEPDSETAPDDVSVKVPSRHAEACKGGGDCLRYYEGEDEGGGHERGIAFDVLVAGRWVSTGGAVEEG